MALGGFAIPVIVLYVFFVIRVLGAGDIKLLCVVGTFMGIHGAIGCIVLSFILGAVYSAFALILRRNLRSRLQYFAAYFTSVINNKEITYYQDGSISKEATIHFSIPILGSVLLYMGGVI